MDTFQQITIGSISSMFSSIIVSPLDVIKTQQQLRENNFSVWKSATCVYHCDGLIGFFRGLTSNLLSRSTFYGTFFPCYSIIKSNLEHKIDNQVIINGISSYTAGLIGSGVANPFYVLKTLRQAEILKINTEKSRMLTHNQNRFKQPLAVSLFKQHGPKAFFRGYGTTCFKNLELAIQLPVYEILKEHHGNHPLNGVISKFVASSVTYPLDTVRMLFRDAQATTLSEALNIIKRRGYHSLYRGYAAYAIKSVPSSALTFALYEALTSMMNSTSI